MSNEVAVSFGSGTGLISRADMARGLNNAAAVAPRVGGDKAYLKMDPKDGTWIYGQDETPIEEGSQWAVNPMSLMYGYVAWGENTSKGPEAEVMVPVTRDPPSIAALRVPDTADGHPSKGPGAWQFQQSADLVCISGEDAGVVCQYKNSTNGAMKLFAALNNALTPRIQNPDEQAIVPIVTMTHESYKNKKFGGRTLNPIWTIVEWRTLDDSSPAKDAPKEEPPKSTRQRATAAPEPAEEEDAALEAEYKQTEAETATPRRRVRR